MPTRKQYQDYQNTTFIREKLPTGNLLEHGLYHAAHWAGINREAATKTAWIIMVEMLCDYTDPFGDELLWKALSAEVTGDLLWSIHKRMQDAITVGEHEVECLARAMYAAIDPTEVNPLLGVIRSLTDIRSIDILTELFTKYHKE